MVYTLCVNFKKESYPESSTNLEFKENTPQQFASPCNVNHRKYMTSQSNDVAACEIGKSHMAFSHGQSPSYTVGNVRRKNLTWLSRIGKAYLTPVKM
jgi:beta-glucanase (GH16 family)